MGAPDTHMSVDTHTNKRALIHCDIDIFRPRGNAWQGRHRGRRCVMAVADMARMSALSKVSVFMLASLRVDDVTGEGESKTRMVSSSRVQLWGVSFLNVGARPYGYGCFSMHCL